MTALLSALRELCVENYILLRFEPIVLRDTIPVTIAFASGNISVSAWSAIASERRRRI